MDDQRERLSQEALAESQGRRRKRIKTFLQELDKDSLEAAGLYPLPPWEDLANFHTITNLLQQPFSEERVERYSPIFDIEIQLEDEKTQIHLIRNMLDTIEALFNIYYLGENNPLNFTTADPSHSPAQLSIVYQSIATLAICLFECHNCGGIAGNLAERRLHVCNYGGWKWNATLRYGAYVINIKLVEEAAELVRTAGLDPRTATHREMQALGNKFSCSKGGCKEDLGTVCRTFDQMVSSFLISV